MAYATRHDIEMLYGAQYLETLVAADLNMDVAVARACETATAEINLYLGQRYSLPIGTVPELVKSWCIDIACWKLAPNAAQNSKETTDRVNRCFAMLKDLAAGKGRIDELEPTPPSGGGSAGGIPTGEEAESAQGGAVFSSDRRRYGQGGGL